MFTVLTIFATFSGQSWLRGGYIFEPEPVVQSSAQFTMQGTEWKK
jgi:hypothetical protein